MDIAIVISIAATVLTATAVFVNAWQLRVARIAAGGLAWTVDWSQTHTDESFGPYTAKVRLVGPGVANEVKVMVDGADDIGVALATHRRVVATSDQIVVSFSVAKTEAANARLVVLWSTPMARGTRTEAVRFSVEPTSDGPSFEEWRWYRTAGMRAWYRRKRTPASAYVTGAPVKPLGKWKTKKSWFAMPGEGPIPIDDNRYDRTLI